MSWTPPPPDRSLPFHIYLSHAHADFLLIDRLWRVLDHMGLRAYMYEHYPHPGSTPREAVVQAIQDSSEVVIFLTDAGAGSAWVHQELGAALALGKPIIPVVQVDAPQAPGLAQFQQPILFDPRQPEAALSSVLWLLRVDFELFDGALSVECPNCQEYLSLDLPSLQAVRFAMDNDRPLNGNSCGRCQRPIHLSPWTLEPVSEQLAMGRAWGE